MFPCIFWAQSLFCGIVAVSFREMVWTHFFLTLPWDPLGDMIQFDYYANRLKPTSSGHDGLLVRGFTGNMVVSNSYLSNTAIFSHDYGRKKVNMPEKKGPQKERIVSLSHPLFRGCSFRECRYSILSIPQLHPLSLYRKNHEFEHLALEKHNYSWRYTPFFRWTIIMGDV